MGELIAIAALLFAMTGTSSEKETKNTRVY